MTGIASESETPDAPKSPAGGPAIYFDGKSNQRRVVTLLFTDRLEIREDDTALAAWAYADIRRADGPAGMLRLSSLTATLAYGAPGDTVTLDLANSQTGLIAFDGGEYFARDGRIDVLAGIGGAGRHDANLVLGLEELGCQCCSQSQNTSTSSYFVLVKMSVLSL